MLQYNSSRSYIFVMRCVEFGQDNIPVTVHSLHSDQAEGEAILSDIILL